MATVSTYVLAEEAYYELQGYYTQAGLTAPNAATPTYGDMAIAVRSALRDLDRLYGTMYSQDPQATEIDAEYALDFKKLILYYTMNRVYTGLSATSTEVQIGPIRVKNTNVQAQGYLAHLARQVAGLIDLSLTDAGTIKQTPREFNDAYVSTESEY